MHASQSRKAEPVMTKQILGMENKRNSGTPALMGDTRPNGRPFQKTRHYARRALIYDGTSLSEKSGAWQASSKLHVSAARRLFPSAMAGSGASHILARRSWVRGRTSTPKFIPIQAHGSRILSIPQIRWSFRPAAGVACR